MSPTCLLYGASGYTGTLIARLAKEKNIPLVLAGRSASKVKILADELGMEYSIFDLKDPLLIRQKIHGFSIVLNAAGPFVHTALPMMQACIAEKVHYLDITGEIQVFEQAATLDRDARSSGIMLMPGTGFDVVPTDCMALYLKNQLPETTHLQLAFATYGGKISHGTALSMIENIGTPGAIRQNGLIRPVPPGYKTLMVPFEAEKERFCMCIPWGDVSTAYYTTAIPNIETFMAFRQRDYKLIKLSHRYFGFLLRNNLVRNLMRNRIKNLPPGPTEEERKQSCTRVWGKVWNADGQSKSARMVVPNGYTLTAESSLHIVNKIWDGHFKMGFQTPALAYDEGLITEICGAAFENI